MFIFKYNNNKKKLCKHFNQHPQVTFHKMTIQGHTGYWQPPILFGLCKLVCIHVYMPLGLMYDSHHQETE